jgi:hypothetical protein
LPSFLFLRYRPPVAADVSALGAAYTWYELAFTHSTPSRRLRELPGCATIASSALLKARIWMSVTLSFLQSDELGVKASISLQSGVVAPLQWSRNGDLPDVVQLHFRRAPGFERLSHDQYVALLREQVAQAEAKAAANRREKGIELIGRKAVLKQRWSDRPITREPRRGLSPRVACRNKWARIEALRRNKVFLDQYRGARADHLAGRAALFPPGTWWLCRYAGLKCAELGATAPPS